MKITALVENTSHCGLKPVHGLSLYITTDRHCLLFDLGPDGTVFENADALGVDLTQVDTVILSHGHNDHGGALERFLQINERATVYVQRSAFLPHYSMGPGWKKEIGLNPALANHPQIRLLDGDEVIDSQLQVFVVTGAQKCHSSANDTLYDEKGPDTFAHEQNLIIREDKTALVMGCGHTGIVNILDRAEGTSPDLCVGGFHLYNPTTKQTVSTELLDRIARQLSRWEHTDFYTCHCTGTPAFDYLSGQVRRLHYLSCGENISL